MPSERWASFTFPKVPAPSKIEKLMQKYVSGEELELEERAGEEEK